MPEQTLMEIYLSEESAQKRHEELNKMVEADVIPEYSPCEEKIISCESKLSKVRNEHQAFSFMGNRNLLPAEVTIKESDFIVKERKLKSQLFDVIAEASQEEYEWWVSITLWQLHEYCQSSKAGGIDIDFVAFRIEILHESREMREKKHKEAAN